MKTKESKLIVHVATDEKFIDAAYHIYEKAFPGLNFFFILQREGEGVKYLSRNNNYFFVNTNTDFVKVIEDYSSDAKLMVFHGINYFQALLVSKLNKGLKKYVWVPFGAEIYNNNLIIKNSSIGPRTYRNFAFSYKKWIKDILRPAYYLIFKGKEIPNKLVKKSFIKMDYATILYEEELLNYKDFGIVSSNIDFIKFTYYPLKIIIEENTEFVNGRNILLGNSASYTNNHIEAFEVLEKFDFSDQKIITTLSYGKKEYANKIIELGSKIFGERFSPLTEFMPLREYQNILQSCGIVIMNHFRQQAVGNVMNAIYLGSKVYLSDRNTLFHYLKRIGCHIYSVEHDLNVENNEVFNLLTFQQMKHNRAIVSSELSLDRVVTELRDKLNPLL
jgi:dTDP-N-acetylfucosamine:lipid II N-acetylfucosaminyltransferase